MPASGERLAGDMMEWSSRAVPGGMAEVMVARTAGAAARGTRWKWHTPQTEPPVMVAPETSSSGRGRYASPSAELQIGLFGFRSPTVARDVGWTRRPDPRMGSVRPEQADRISIY
jgi:hypothetical protein